MEVNSDLSRYLRIRKGKYKGNRDIERPENAPVERFQRDGAGRPEEQGTGMAADAILNNANLPGVSGAERPDL